jgi:hypothetical protein
MRYALLIYNDPKAVEALNEEQRQKMIEEYGAIAKATGFTFGARLKEAETATTVRIRDGQLLVTDGPFADTKEVLGGLALIDASDLDAALEIAAKIPAARIGGSVEVRPVFS